jgi:hypothetical protein
MNIIFFADKMPISRINYPGQKVLGSDAALMQMGIRYNFLLEVGRRLTKSKTYLKNTETWLRMP